jgi:predicted amidophosphoribosyltransferase
MYDLQMELSAKNKDREQARQICSTCARPLDNQGKCPRCLMNKTEITKMLRTRQKDHDMFRNMDQIVAKGW